jgi:hypothetical protein
MATATSDIMVEIKGQNKSLNDALKESSAELAALGGASNKAATETEKLSSAEKKTEVEARNMGEAVRVAADSVGLLGIESGESVAKLYMARDAAADFTRSIGGMKLALVGGLGLTAGFAGLSFLKESVKDAMAGEQATAQLNNALKRTPEIAKQTNEAIEAGAAGWAHYGQGVAEVKAAVAKGAALGIDPKAILDNRKGVEDLAHAMGGDLMTAISSLTAGGERSGRSLRLLNLSMVEQRRLSQQLAYTQDPTARFKMITAAIENSGLAGAADAQAGTAQGKFLAFNKSLENLRETVGTNLLPVVTDMATALTGMVAGANSALAAFGGLGNFLQATWRPILIGGTLLFVGLKLAHTQLGQFLKSTFLGDVSESAGALADEGIQAAKAADALNSIPKDVVTTAQFIDTAARAVKEPYIANINSVPQDRFGTSPVTTAKFVPADVSGYATSIKPVEVPVKLDVPASFAEPIGQTIHVPVQIDTPASFTEPVSTPIHVPVEISAPTSFTEPVGNTIHVPVQIDTQKSFTEPVGTPIHVPTQIDVAKSFTEPVGHTIRVPVEIDAPKSFVEPVGKTIHVPVSYDTSKAFHEITNPRPITVPVEAGSLDMRSAESRINALDAYARAHPATVNVQTAGSTGTIHVTGGNATVTPILDPKANSEMQTIRRTLATEAGAGGPIPVRVRPQWASDAVSGLKGGLAAGVGIGIADAIFNGAVTFKGPVNVPGNAFGSAPKGGYPTLKIADPLPVRVTGTVTTKNIGPIGSAIAFPAGFKIPLPVDVHSIPGVHVAAGARIAISNWPANPIAASGPLGGTTIKMPSSLNVNSKQSGGWTVNLSPDAFLRMGQMIGEIAIGSAIGNMVGGLIGKIPFGAALGALTKFLPKGGGGGDSSFTGGNAVKGVEALLADARGGAAPATPSSNPIHHKGPEHVTSLQDVFNTALKTLQIGAPLGAALYGAFRSGGVIKAAASGIGGMFESAFASIIALISFPIKGLTPTTNKPGQKSGPVVAAAFAGAGLDLALLGMGKAIVTKVGEGIAAGWSGLVSAVKGLFTSLVNAVISQVNSFLSHIPGTSPIKLVGGSSSSGQTAGHAGHQAIFTPLPASLAGGSTAHHVAAHHAAMAKPIVHHHAAAKHTTTIHQTNTFNVNGAKDPHATAMEVQRALQSVATAASRKRQHGR